MLPEPPASTPALYAQDGKGLDAIVHAHYFLPGTGMDWYVTEYDRATGEAFGWAEILPGCGELGYFRHAELDEVKTPIKMTSGTGTVMFYSPMDMERGWTPRPLRDILTERQARR